MHSRARRLEIAVSIYSPARGSRPDYRIEKDSGSRVRGLRSGHLVFRKALFYHCGLTIFGNLEDFFVLIFLLSCLLCNPNKIL